MSGPMAQTGGLILAAGLSSRMGAFKPLLHFAGVTVLEAVIGRMRSAGVGRIVVVTGFRGEELAEPIRSMGAEQVHNPDFRGDMSLSVRLGLEALMRGGPCSGVLLTPVDCPAVTAADYRLVAENAGEDYACAGFLGRKGHPLYIPGGQIPGLIAYGGDGGMKGAMQGREVRIIDSPNEGVLLDMDTPEGYDRLLAFARSGYHFPTAAEALAGRRVFFVRHGEIRQHGEPVFLGQYDPPLSELGLLQAQHVAEELTALQTSAEMIVTSPLHRAAQTAECLSAAVGLPVVPLDELKEISLGQWDGRFVREIRESQPEAFARRGEDKLRFAPPGGESMIHLRIRVLEALRKLAKLSHSRDVIAVTHAGVINTALSLLEDRPDEVLTMEKPPLGGIVRWENEQ